jgi:hypothetical protein
MDKFLVATQNNPTPKSTSAKPLQKTIAFGFGIYFGIIRRYTLGFTKCIIPPKI